MKFIEGGNLDQTPRPVRDHRAAAQLMAVIAHAVHHAHQRGIMHRDLKPANILLSRKAEVPNPKAEKASDGKLSDFDPLVTDFGLAMAVKGAVGQTDDVKTVCSAAFAGTPGYMSLNRPLAKPHLTTAVDVYGLGATLYNLLTGKPPFHGATLQETLSLVQHAPLLKPRKLQRKISRDLETICLKCLEKEPTRRYGSAEALAEDLERFVEGKPLACRPVGAVERTMKWAKRRPGIAALTLSLVLLAVVGVAAISVQERRVAGSLRESQTNLYFSRIRQADGDLLAGQPDRANAVLKLCPKESRQWEWYYLKRRCHRNEITLQGHERTIQALQYSHDGSSLATASLDQSVILWDPHTGEQQLKLDKQGIGVTSVCFSGDDRFVITAAEDRIVRIWDAKTGKKLREQRNAGQIVVGSRTDRFVALDRERFVTVWQVEGSQPLFRLPKQETSVCCLALSPDGLRLAIAGYDNLLDVWDLSAAEPQLLPKLTFPNKPSTITIVWSVAFNTDGTRICACQTDVREWAWNGKSFEQLGVLSGIGDLAGESIAYSCDSQKIAVTDHAGRVRVWDRKTGATVLGPNRNKDFITGVAFNPKVGGRLAVIRGREVTIEDLTPPADSPSFILKDDEDDQNNKHYEALAFSSDGRWLASRAGKEIFVWDVAKRQRVRKFTLGGTGETRAASLTFSQDCRRLFAAGAGRQLQVWDVKTGESCTAPVVSGEDLRCAAFSHDGQRLAVAGWGGGINFWTLGGAVKDNNEAHAAGEVFALSFHPDDRQLVSCGREGIVQSWDMAGKKIRSYEGHNSSVTAAVFSPGDGKRLATSGADMTVRIWDTDSGKQLRILEHSGFVSSVAFAKGGRRLAAGASDRTVKIWDPDSGQEVLSLTGHSGPVSAVAFSPSGHLLASCSYDGTVRLWDATAP